MKLFILSLSSVILVAVALRVEDPEQYIANDPRYIRGEIPLLGGPSSESNFGPPVREERRRRLPGRGVLAWMRRQLSTHSHRSAALQATNVHVPLPWRTKIIEQGPGWYYVLYDRNFLSTQFREHMLILSVPRPSMYLPDVYEAGHPELEHPSAAFEPTQAESEQQLAASEVTNSGLEDQSAMSQATNEQFRAGPWRRTLIQRGEDWRVLLFDRNSLLDSFCENFSFHHRERRLLQIRRDAVVRSTTILGYMPYDKQHLLQLPTGQDTVSLGQALRLLATTTPSRPQGEEATSDHAGGGLERAMSSNSENMQHQQDEAESDMDQPISPHKTPENPDGSSSSNHASNKISHVLLGSQNMDQCGICLSQFDPPVPHPNGQWSFSQVQRIEECRHYFHPRCIRRWLIKYKMEHCPTCRTLV